MGREMRGDARRCGYLVRIAGTMVGLPARLGLDWIWVHAPVGPRRSVHRWPAAGPTWLSTSRGCNIGLHRSDFAWRRAVARRRQQANLDHDTGSVLLPREQQQPILPARPAAARGPGGK